MYYYVVDEYKVSNELLTEDIYVRDSIMSLQGGNMADMISGSTICGDEIRRIRQGT